MSKVSLSIFLLVGLAFGQQPSTSPETSDGHSQDLATTATTHPVERVQTPSYGDRYCAGFISKEPVTSHTFVAGGLHSPHATKFVKDEVIYLSGSNFKLGDQITLLRELRDPNQYELFPGQRKLLAETGQPYAELGHAKIIDLRHKMAIAQIQFICQPVVIGDVAVPFIERQTISYRSPERFDRYALPTGKASGRIVLAKEFDGFVGNGNMVYLTVGSNQGVKVGDYFRVSRTYDQDLDDPVDSLSFKASTAEDTQKHPPTIGSKWWQKGKGPSIEVDQMPRRSVGEAIVLSTTATSATAMITFALEDIHVGDDVEMIDTTQAATASDGATPAN